MMPSRGRKFITEFLLPSLNEEKFGSRLMWLDIENKVFQIQWNHKSASDWTTNDAAVFAAWDKRKGHYNPNDREYYPKSKQRFRAALYKFIKLKHITELCSEDKYTKIYCIGDGKNISGTYITVVKNEEENKGNENSQIKVKRNPEDLVTDFNSNWNYNLSTKENSMISCNPEMKEEYFVNEEQVVTDYTEEFIEDTLYDENPLKFFQSFNSSSDNKKKFSIRETSNIMKESKDVDTLHVELHFVTETNNNEDNNLKRRVMIENENFHDYLSTAKEPLREFCDTDEDLSLDRYFHVYDCYEVTQNPYSIEGYML